MLCAFLFINVKGWGVSPQLSIFFACADVANLESIHGASAVLQDIQNLEHKQNVLK